MAPILVGAALAVLAGQASPARADARLVDEPLRLELPAAMPASSALDLAAVADPEAAPGLDFDLLGEPPPAPKSDARRTRRRNLMLRAHQAIGLGLVGVQIGTTTVGQLNYNDKFGGGGNTNRYKQLHAGFAWTNVALFAVGGGLALLAPSPPGIEAAQARRGARVGFDRVRLHRWSMLVAALGMATQGVLGVYTASREGFENQERYGKAHLVVGYTTLAALTAGVATFVF